MEHGEITFSEIQSQPALWAKALDLFGAQAKAITAFWTQGSFDQVILTGCGSTYYLGVIAGTLLQASTGTPAHAYSASELILYPQANFSPHINTLLICVSRSGTTRETVESVRQFRQHGKGQVLVVTCYSESSLAASADLVLAIDEAREESRVQTRSFSSMAVTLTALAALLGGQDWQQLHGLSAALDRLLPASEPLMRQLGDDMQINQFAFLASGSRYALACEAMLKMTEMSRVFSVAYHTLEYLHGPRYAADAGTLVVGLVSDAAYDEEVRALQPLSQRRARVLALAESERGGLAGFDHHLLLASGMPEWGRTILYLPPLQLLGFYQAIKRGFNPDNLPFDPRDPVAS